MSKTKIMSFPGMGTEELQALQAELALEALETAPILPPSDVDELTQRLYGVATEFSTIQAYLTQGQVNDDVVDAFDQAVEEHFDFLVRLCSPSLLRRGSPLRRCSSALRRLFLCVSTYALLVPQPCVSTSLFCS